MKIKPNDIAQEQESCSWLTLSVKSFCIWSFSGKYFLAFGLNTDDTHYLSAFSPYAEKYGPETFRIQALFTQCQYH